MEPQTISLTHHALLSICNLNLADEIVNKVLDEKFINDFLFPALTQYFKSHAEQKDFGSPITLVIIPTMMEFLGTDCPDIKSTFMNNASAFFTNFYLRSRQGLLADIASREIYKESIREFVVRNSAGGSRIATPTRFNAVYNDFLKCFKEQYSAGYAFEGTFLTYLNSCFRNQYFVYHRKDIYDVLNERDLARAEYDFFQEVQLEPTAFADIDIQGYLRSIYEANKLLFMHTGHSTEDHGICYDLVRLLIRYMSETHVENMNKQNAGKGLSAIKLNYVDVEDPADKEFCTDAKIKNRGISAKIANGREILQVVFDAIDNHKLSESNMAQLRKQMLVLGLNVIEGNNCPWKTCGNTKVAAQVLTDPAGRENYHAVSVIVNGVIAAYNLLSEMRKRGISIIAAYDKDLFTCSDIIRHIDYLSALPELPLIKHLQDESRSIPSIPELYSFDTMMNVYAGSDTSGKKDLKVSRTYSAVNGMLVNPRLKRSMGVPRKSDFDTICQVRDKLLDIPRSRDSVVKFHLTKVAWNNWKLAVEPSMLGFRANEYLRYNMYLRNNDSVANGYIGEVAGNGEYHCLEESFLSVNVNLHLRDGEIIPVEAFYDPFIDRFVSFCLDKETGFPSAHYVFPNNEAVVRDPSVSCWQMKSGPCYDWVIKYLNEDRSLSVPSRSEEFIATHYGPAFKNFIGLGFDTKDINDALRDNAIVNKNKSTFILMYYNWFRTVSNIQYSIMDTLKACYAHALSSILNYYDSPELRVSMTQEQIEKERGYASEFVRGFIEGKYEAGSLEYFLRLAYDKSQVAKGSYGKSCFSWIEAYPGVNQYCQSRLVDTSFLDYIFRDTLYSSEEQNVVTDPLVPYKTQFGSLDTVAKRFEALYCLVEVESAWLMKLRDTFELLVPLYESKTNLMTIELNNQFRALDNIKGGSIDLSFCPLTVEKSGYRAERESADRVQEFSNVVLANCLDKFNGLVEMLVNYVQSCKADLIDFTGSEVSGNDNQQGQFEECGTACLRLPSIDLVSKVKNLAERAHLQVDNFGYLIDGRKHIFVRYQKVDYYIHSSGHIIRKSGGRYSIFDKAETLNTCREILRIAEEKLNVAFIE